MISTHDTLVSRSASAVVSRVGIGRTASPALAPIAPVAMPAVMPCAQAHNHLHAYVAFNGRWAIDAATGGEGSASKQLTTGAALLPATAASGTSKFRPRRLRIPSP